MQEDAKGYERGVKTGSSGGGPMKIGGLELTYNCVHLKRWSYLDRSRCSFR